MRFGGTSCGGDGCDGECDGSDGGGHWMMVVVLLVKVVMLEEKGGRE